MQTQDVIIIGGGVIGCSIAYHLAKKGADVVVLERDHIGAHASSAAAGMLGAQVEMAFPGPMIELCLRSRAMFPELGRDLYQWSGLDIELNTAGLLRVAWDRTEAEQLRDRARWQRELGGRAEWWETRSVREDEPEVGTGISGALFLPDDAQVSAPRLTLAFARAAQALGARLMEGCEVTGFLTEGDRVTGVETANGVFRAGTVVLAAGAWSGVMARRLGLHLPVFPVKGESLALRPNRQLLQKTLFAHGCYLVPKADGRIVVGATEREHDFSAGVSLGAIHQLAEEAVRLIPSLAQADLFTYWSSVRPGSGDGLPLMGPLAAVRGLYVASGHFRNGILLSPITGALMAELIAGRAVPELAPFSPNRLLESAADGVRR